MNRQEIMACFKNFPIYGITAEKMSQGRDNLYVVREMLEAGIRFIQYREKEKSALLRYEECLKLRKLTREYGAAFIIDDFVDLALAVEADGVHIGQDDLPPLAVRRLLGPDKVIGLSTHSMEQYEKAVALKDIIDYIGVGPVYATSTKATALPVGLEYVNYAKERGELPFVTIGGIKEDNIAPIFALGIDNIAVVSDIVMADNIQEKIGRLAKSHK